MGSGRRRREAGVDEEQTRIMTRAGATSAAADERVHFVERVHGVDGRRHVITTAGAIVGRREPADIVLPDSEVSRAHCRLVVQEDELWVIDLASTNGTFVNGERVVEPKVVPAGGLLQVGRQILKHEWRTQREWLQTAELDRDLDKANAYVHALLPNPIVEGSIRAEWFYRPSAKLGGDALGFGPLPDGRFYAYLMDVSGHGAGAAMHSVAAMNVMRQRALPETDMGRPSEVLAALNAMFQMDSHADMYFTLWYGVFDPATRRLEYASAGHHPAFLVPPGRAEAIPLRTRNGLIGALPGKSYASAEAEAAPGTMLYLFSDGVFEIVTKGGDQWGLSDVLPLILKEPVPGLGEGRRLFGEVTGAAGQEALDDDFTVVVLTFD
jgi:serine phosphatase RsbU (regulator of sigma subunit)